MSRKHIICKTVTRADDRGAYTTVIASTDAIDRMDDVVDQSWVLEDYQSNPVILWGHDYSLPPIGRAESIGVVNGNLEAVIRWDTGTELGATVARQFSEGFLSAVSVGFKPGRSVSRAQLGEGDPRRKDGDPWNAGFVYFDNKLLEISAVSVPANSEALAQRGLPPMADPIDPIDVAADHAEEADGATLRQALVDLLLNDAAVQRIVAGINLASQMEPTEDDNATDFWAGLTEDSADDFDWFE